MEIPQIRKTSACFVLSSILGSKAAMQSVTKGRIKVTRSEVDRSRNVSKLLLLCPPRTFTIDGLPAHKSNLEGVRLTTWFALGCKGQ
ncbi:hypothetical protein Ddc_14243 [Ditylenchus destructor]|nr:hypothetical protein Ddc_14243 [Ditylenchus destructor]